MNVVWGNLTQNECNVLMRELGCIFENADLSTEPSEAEMGLVNIITGHEIDSIMYAKLDAFCQGWFMALELA